MWSEPFGVDNVNTPARVIVSPLFTTPPQPLTCDAFSECPLPVRGCRSSFFVEFE
jgi:hypothetical protein